MKTSSTLFHVAALVSVLGLAGCAVGPDYKAPTLPVRVQAFSTEPALPVEQTKPWWERTDPALRSLVERALAENRDVRTAQASLREARALRSESRYSFLPLGSVGAGYSRQLGSAVAYPGIPRAQRKQDLFELGVDSAWELDLFGRIRRAVEANTALEGAADANLAQIQLLVAAETARNYVDLALVQTAIPRQRDIVHHEEEILRLIELQVFHGKTSKDRLASPTAELDSGRNTLAELLVSERALRNRLGVLTGGTALPASYEAHFPSIPLPSLGGDPAQILSRRPDVQSAERRLAAATAAIGFTRADYFPKLSFAASVGAQANKIDQLNSAEANLFSIGPRLQWDLLSLHKTRARVKAAEAQCEQALDTWENSVLLALEEIDNAQANLEAGRDILRNQIRTLAATNESLRIARLCLAEGKADPLVFHTANRDALNTELAKLRAEGELANAVIFLQKSLALDR